MKKGIIHYLDNEYKQYAHYVVKHRAIPSVIDGFKPVNRKIFYSSLKHVKKTKDRVSNLAGHVIADTQYHHGNVPCEEAIVLMTQTFKNNLPLFSGEGQFGSLKEPAPAASRYIKVCLNDNWNKIFTDFELLDYREEEEKKIEPFYYLPLIPLVLINGSSGVALGHATKILNRNPSDVVDACINVLKKQPIPLLTPCIDGFIGTFTQDSENPKKWAVKGIFEKVSATQVNIKEIPPTYTLEKYENFLDKLIENKKILSWSNHGTKEIDYRIKFQREDLVNKTDEEILKTLDLVEFLTENFTTIDENDEIKIFDNYEDLIKYFVEFRLTYYHKRKIYLLDKVNKEMFDIAQKGKFIKCILSGKIIINKKTKLEIIEQIKQNDIKEIEGSYDTLLKMPIHSLSKDTYDELVALMNEKKAYREEIESGNPIKWYGKELVELKKLLKK